MNKNSTAQELLALAKEKLSCLQTLKSDLQLFCDSLETAEKQEIMAYLEKEAAYRRQITEIDQKYESLKNSGLFKIDFLLYLETLGEDQTALDVLPQETIALYDILKEQRILLKELMGINEQAQHKAQTLQDAYKEKIRDIVQQKNMITDYLSNQQKGILFDYKEGRKR